MAKKWVTVKRNKHCVYRLDYHLVFVVKYRQKCITEEMGEAIVARAKKLAERNGGELLEGKSDRDHVHLLVSMPPAMNLADFVGSVKMATSKLVQKEFHDEVAPYLWGTTFWSPSYYIASAGGASLDTIQQYIQNQTTKPRTKNIRREDP